MTTISAEDLTIAYGQRTIIDKLSFYIPEGKITTIIGANGCGKSSLLKALTRLLPPKQGIVYLNGQNIATLETKEVAKKLALLPQVQEATNGITVYELVSYGRFPHQSYFGNLSPADKKPFIGLCKPPMSWPMLINLLMLFLGGNVKGFGLQWH